MSTFYCLSFLEYPRVDFFRYIVIVNIYYNLLLLSISKYFKILIQKFIIYPQTNFYLIDLLQEESCFRMASFCLKFEKR